MPKSACPTGKICYRSPQQAHKMYASPRIKHRILAVYRCDECPSWHLGSSEKNIEKLREFKTRRTNLSMLPIDPEEY